MVVPAVGLAWLLVSLSPGQAPVSMGALESHLEDASGHRVMIKIVTPEIVRVAQTFLDLKLGEERYATVGGHHYVFVLETHYHPPGFVGAPTGYHKGVTVYELR
jgi:hypothetical protein